MSIIDYPQNKCQTCKQNIWWYTTIEKDYKGPPQWLCGTCHPPGSELGQLRMRFVKGNYILNQSREIINAMPNEEQRTEARREWWLGVSKLAELAHKISLINTDCPYIENGKKLKRCTFNAGDKECFGCMNDYWWQTELFDNDKAKHPEVYK